MALAASAQAHGIKAEIQGSARAVVVVCSYSNGDPVDAEVAVYSPVETTRIFQRMRTDVRGFASFVPDAPGAWRVVADDGMGHRTELELTVGDDGVVASAAGGATYRSAVVAAALALALGIWWFGFRRSARTADLDGPRV